MLLSDYFSNGRFWDHFDKINFPLSTELIPCFQVDPEPSVAQLCQESLEDRNTPSPDPGLVLPVRVETVDSQPDLTRGWPGLLVILPR